MLRGVYSGAVWLVFCLLGTSAWAGGLMTAPEPLVLPSWSGFYAGGSIGWSGGDTDVSNVTANGVRLRSLSDLGQLFSGFPLTITNTRTSSSDLKPDGVLGGVRGGYNYQWGSWVAGVEGDYSWSDQSDDLNASVTGTILGFPFSGKAKLTSEVESIGTVRARFGRIMFDDLLVYATGGYAFGRMKISETATATVAGTSGSLRLSDSNMHDGWTVGGGVEKRVGQRVSVNVEYLHVDLGDETYRWTAPGLNETFDVGLTDEIVRVGLNIKISP